MSHYFFNLEKSNQKRKSIQRLRKKDGGFLTHSKEILEHQRKFFAELYAQKQLELCPLPFVVHKMLQENAKQELDRPLTIQELDNSLSQMCTGKTPGPDGLSVNFYNKFWTKIREILFEALVIGLQQRKLHATAYHGLIVLLPKKHRDLLEVENWRPLTMLNNDYKILSKALANRMQKIMPDIISEEQAGFMKGRFIRDNILTLQTIIEYLHDTGQEALLLAVDIQRAYDEISHEALWNILDYFNYGPEFISFVQTLYKFSKCSVTSNGWISQQFNTTVGVKQGDPISSFLFLNVMQVLSIILENNADIETVEINGIKKFYGLYADDVWNVIKNTEASIEAIVRVYEYFRCCTHLRINYNKTEVMRIGSLQDTEAQSYVTRQLKWTSGPVTILGVKIHNDMQVTRQQNYMHFKDKFVHRLTGWQYRGLSLLGKILIVNTLLISQLIYKMIMVCSMSEEQFLELKRIIVNFLWDGKKAKIAYDKLILKYNKGGLQLHNLRAKDKAMKLSWVSKILSNSERASYIGTFFSIPSRVLFRANISPKQIKRMTITSAILKQILAFWSKVNFKIPQDKEEILDQVIWFNSCSDNPLEFREDLYEAGIVTIRNFFDENNCRFYNCQELANKYDVKVNFLQLYRLIQAVPHHWRVKLRAQDRYEELSIRVDWFDLACKGIKISKEIYWSLIDKRALGPQNSMLKWSQDLSIAYEVQAWSKICVFPWKMTLSTKLRMFQYQITQRCLVTNIHLFHYGIKNLSNCTFCNREPETIIHLLWRCDKIRRFWNEVFDIIKYNFDDNRIPHGRDDLPQKIIFNTLIKDPRDYLNTVILVAKRHIYVSRCQSTALNVNGFFNQLIYYKDLEKYIAVKNNKLDKHLEKWEKIK